MYISSVYIHIPNISVVDQVEVYQYYNRFEMAPRSLYIIPARREQGIPAAANTRATDPHHKTTPRDHHHDHQDYNNPTIDVGRAANSKARGCEYFRRQLFLAGWRKRGSKPPPGGQDRRSRSPSVSSHGSGNNWGRDRTPHSSPSIAGSVVSGTSPHFEERLVRWGEEARRFSDSERLEKLARPPTPVLRSPTVSSAASSGVWERLRSPSIRSSVSQCPNRKSSPLNSEVGQESESEFEESEFQHDLEQLDREFKGEILPGPAGKRNLSSANPVSVDSNLSVISLDEEAIREILSRPEESPQEREPVEGSNSVGSDIFSDSTFSVISLSAIARQKFNVRQSASPGSPTALSVNRHNSREGVSGFTSDTGDLSFSVISLDGEAIAEILSRPQKEGPVGHSVLPESPESEADPGLTTTGSTRTSSFNNDQRPDSDSLLSTGHLGEHPSVFREDSTKQLPSATANTNPNTLKPYTWRRKPAPPSSRTPSPEFVHKGQKNTTHSREEARKSFWWIEDGNQEPKPVRGGFQLRQRHSDCKEMALSPEYPDEQRRFNNHTPGEIDQDEGGASLLSEVALQPGGPELHSPSPFPRLESPKREDDFIHRVHDEDDDDENLFVGRAETTEGDLSMPVEHRRHLMDMDSSFRLPRDTAYHEEEHGGQDDYPDDHDQQKQHQEELQQHESTQKLNMKKAESSFGQDEDFEDFDDFSMIHPEQTPSLKSRRSFIRSIITQSRTEHANSASSNVSSSKRNVGDMGPPPLPPLHRINSRSTQRRLERSYSHTSSARSKSRGRKIPEVVTTLPSSDSFEMSSPLPQHIPSSDDFAPSSPILSAQARKQQNYGDSGRKQDESAPRPGRLHRSESTTSTKSAGRRPKFLRSRHNSSARSSISSVHSNVYPNEHDDYDATDGGSTILGTTIGKRQDRQDKDRSPERPPLPERDLSRGRDQDRDRSLSQDRGISRGNSRGEQFGGPLSRSTSLGSIASGVTGLGSMTAEASGNPVRIRKSLDALTEVKSGVDENPHDDDRNPPLPPETAFGDDDDDDRSDYDNDNPSPSKIPLPRGESPDFNKEPQTPKNAKPPMPHPTMTAVNNQVSQVMVPATIARQISSNLKYPQYQYGVSPRKWNSPGGPTLKEQEAVIQKLGKENFDLKIKVYYLNQKLSMTSEEGIAEVHQENVDLKLKVVSLRKEVRMLKQQLRDAKLDRPRMEDMKNEEEEEEADRDRREMEIEIVELREKVERYELEFQRLKRRMAGENGGGPSGEVSEDVEILKDLLENESLRREQAELDNQRLRDEIWRMQQGQGGGQHSSSNLQPPYSTTRRTSATSHSDGNSNTGGSTVGPGGASRPNQATDTASLLARLRAENEELKRDLGAQTSMLTSRNRERDGLYAQIEDLKLSMRSGGALRPTGSSSSMTPGSDQPRFQHLHHGEFSNMKGILS